MGKMATLERVDKVMDSMERLLADIKKNQMVAIEKQSESINTEKDRKSYKEGLVDGLCMTSWVGKDGNDYIGEKNNEGTGKLLSDVIEEIGITFGFDGKEELARVKAVDENADPTLKEVTDADVEGEEFDNFQDTTKDY